jgi:hypothetical protein
VPDRPRGCDGLGYGYDDNVRDRSSGAITRRLAGRSPHALEASTLQAVMPEGSPRWIALTTANVVVIVVGIMALISGRSLFGYVVLVVGAVGFVAIWTLRRAATEQALRAIAWAIIWFATGG